MSCQKYFIALFAVISPLIMVSIVDLARADIINPGLYSPSSKPYGFTLPQWSEKWWRWFVGIPQSNNPVNDPTGSKCGVNQNESNVEFLIATGSGTVVRTCTIPAGKAIFFPGVGNECSFAENPSLKTESELRTCAIAGDQPTSVHVSIDGRSLQNLQQYITLTPIFNMTFPENNVFGAPSGPTQSVSHQYDFFFAPLSPGNHVIHLDQETVGNPATGTESTAYSRIDEFNYCACGGNLGVS